MVYVVVPRKRNSKVSTQLSNNHHHGHLWFFWLRSIEFTCCCIISMVIRSLGRLSTRPPVRKAVAIGVATVVIHSIVTGLSLIKCDFALIKNVSQYVTLAAAQQAYTLSENSSGIYQNTWWPRK